MNVGERFKSQVCTTEVIVVRAAGVPLCCGGQPMIPLDSEPEAGLILDPALCGGSQLGKRYVDADGGLEVLVTKPGDGTLTASGQALTVQAAKALPSSD